MKRLTLVLLALTSPLWADDDRHQSFIAYDVGGTIVSGEDGRDIEVGVNTPLFSGDRLATSARGRVEVRLSDGNVLAVDRDTVVDLVSVLGDYEMESDETIIGLTFGKVLLHQTGRRSEPVRLDTRFATYRLDDSGILAVETSDRGDSVAVIGGIVNLSLPTGRYQVRTGERIRVDERGIYDEAGLARDGMDDFERWYMRRNDDGRRSSRYLGDRLAYADPLLDAYGRWVYVHEYSNWVWRPTVSVGWRPYYSGYWHRGRRGGLVWVSSEPWGWVPYHYGSWAHSPLYGWVWIPGNRYSHAWVYWLWGPSYVGWAPRGYYDCFQPYFGWAFNRGRRISVGIGFDVWGRVHVSDGDLNQWTLVRPDHLVSTRVDRAALTTDAIRERLQRDGRGATFTGGNPRLGEEDLRNPAEAVERIARRTVGGGTGTVGSGPTSDVTRFFRRDPDLPESDRDRIARALDRATPRASDSPRTAGETATTPSSGGVRGPSIQRRVPSGSGETSDRITRTPARNVSGSVDESRRGAISRPAPERPAPVTPERPAIVTPERPATVTPERPTRQRVTEPDSRSNAGETPRQLAVPRRVIDSIESARESRRRATRSSEGSDQTTRRAPASDDWRRRPAASSPEADRTPARTRTPDRTPVRTRTPDRAPVRATPDRTPVRTTTPDRTPVRTTSPDRSTRTSAPRATSPTRSRSVSRPERSSSSSTRSSSSSTRSSSSSTRSSSSGDRSSSSTRSSSSSKSSSSSSGRVSRRSKPDDR
ncbi:MAG: FecR domain-containing protein [Acidobacteria bacterium]|nr:FecR domain-containing protein [Acidobacteriota bacterium]